MAGDVLDTRQFPVIDVERGGSIQGEIAALNRLSELAVPSVPIVSREAGTIVIPGHGRLYDQYDVIEYRDMVTIIRDRVRDLVAAGQSLDAGQGRRPGQGLRGALRQRGRRVDDGPLRRGRVPEPREGEAVRRRDGRGAGARSCGARGPAVGRGATAGRRRRTVSPRLGADRPDRLLGVLRHRELALSDGDAAQGGIPPHSGRRRRPCRSSTPGIRRRTSAPATSASHTAPATS